MRRFIIATLLIAACAAISTWFLPWWSLAPVTALISFLCPQSPGRAFLSGFLGIGILWLLWGSVSSYRNDFLLADKMALLFRLAHGWQFLPLSALPGALVGGLSALSIALLRAAK